MTLKIRVLLVTRLLVALLGLVALAPLQAQEMLQIGRTDLNSPLSDIAERVVTEALRRSGLRAQFNAMPLQRSIALVNDAAHSYDLNLFEVRRDYRVAELPGGRKRSC